MPFGDSEIASPADQGGMDRDRSSAVRAPDAAHSEAMDSLAWSRGAQIAFVGAAMPLLVLLLAVAPYLLSHYVVNRHDRFNYVPPPLGGDRALEGHWTDAPLAPARLVEINTAERGFGWIVADDDRVVGVFPSASGRVGQVFASVGQAVAKDAPLFSIRPMRSSAGAGGSFTDIVVASPIAGTITEIDVAPGAAVKAGQAHTAASALVADLSSVWLAADVAPTLARALRVDATVEVHPTALADRTFAGRVLTVSPVDPATGRATVRIRIDNADGALKPDMLATFSTPAIADEALVVPEGAVLFENGAARVFVMERESDAPGASKKLVARAIRVGRIEDGWVEATEGLKPGDEVEATDAVFIDRAAKGY
jgi:multidrug efflux pump subunit AcrA (membrane-fusion protein)